ncbi:MAG: alpha/beta hydrolase [Actinomycetes bacterium]
MTGSAHRTGAAALVLAAAVMASGCSSPGPSTPGRPSTPASGTATAGPTRPGAVPTLTPGPVTAPPAPDLASFYSQRLRWSACGGGFQCATLAVPLDYTDPAKGTVGIAVIRLPASGPGVPLGSLVLNPGGPGGSGVQYVRAARVVVSASVRARYDIVGFDPRGVGSSDPIACLTNAQQDRFLAANGAPTTPAQVAALVGVSRMLADGCQARSARLLPYVATVDVARDMDVLRAALGQRQLDYLGASYGTFLGATYAGLFPARLGRMVLDGAIDPALTGDQVDLGQAIGFERQLGAFVTACVAQPGCPLPGPSSAGLAAISGLLARTLTQPLPSSSGRPVTQALVMTGIIASLYDPVNGWPLLRTALGQALRGAGDGMLQLADFYTGRRSDGSYQDNSNQVIYAVTCLDRPWDRSLSSYEANATAFAKVAPIFGAYLAWSPLPCAYWPDKPVDAPHPIHAPGAAPILVVGTTGDPATPYPWAKALAAQLDSGRLLTYVGNGHTAYRRGSSCVDAAVDTYLLAGTLPAVGTTCH